MNVQTDNTVFYYYYYYVFYLTNYLSSISHLKDYMHEIKIDLDVLLLINLLYIKAL